MSAADGHRSPWLDLPLSDYEGHMALPQVAQAQLLGDLFAELLEVHAPSSVAILGCAGGNGLERIDRRVTSRVVAVDLNADYLRALRARFDGRFGTLLTVAADIQCDAIDFPPVRMAWAALLFEYVDVNATISRVRSVLEHGGILGTVLQLPSEAAAAVTPSPYVSLRSLSSCLRFVSPELLAREAGQVGFVLLGESERESAGGKRFRMQVFQAQ